jgi:predicted RNase H-like HicB family nuclease
VRAAENREGLQWNLRLACARTANNVRVMESIANATFRVAVHRALGCYLARVVELPGCVGRGVTEVEAVEMARSAIREHLRIARALEGDPATVQLLIRV